MYSYLYFLAFFLVRFFFWAFFRLLSYLFTNYAKLKLLNINWLCYRYTFIRLTQQTRLGDLTYLANKLFNYLKLKILLYIKFNPLLFCVNLYNTITSITIWDFFRLRYSFQIYFYTSTIHLYLHNKIVLSGKNIFLSVCYEENTIIITDTHNLRRYLPVRRCR